MHESHSENNKSKFLPKNVDKTLARLVLYYIRLCSMVFREGSTKIPIRPVVLNKFRELWEYEKKHKKDRTHKYLEVSINDLLQSTLERYERISEYAIFLSVYGYNDDKITLHDVNSNRKTNYLDLNVEDSKLMYAEDNKIGCIYCHFVVFLYDVDVFEISTHYYFDKSDSTGFKIMSREDKVSFANMLKIPLLTMNLGYLWIPDLIGFESLQISRPIYFDGFSKHNFMTTVDSVLHGYEIIASLYEEFRNSVSKRYQ